MQRKEVSQADDVKSHGRQSTVVSGAAEVICSWVQALLILTFRTQQHFNERSLPSLTVLTPSVKVNLLAHAAIYNPTKMLVRSFPPGIR
jgi:hypothetical protein